MTPKSKISSFPWHAFLFSVYPVLHLCRTNAAQVEPGQFFSTAAACLAFSLFLFLALKAARISTAKAGLLATLFNALFFSYGSFFEMWCNFVTDPIAPMVHVTQREEYVYYARLVSHGLLLGVWAAGFIFFFRRLIRSDRSKDTWNTALNLAALFLVLANAIPLGMDWGPYANKRQADAETLETGGAKEKTALPSGLPADSPDIYYIILDGACREDTFEKYYRVYRTRINEELERLGFYVAKESMSNYSETLLSLSSSLNMKHHGDGNPEPLFESNRNDRPYYEMIRNNSVLRYLKSKGYLTVHLGSIWIGTMSNPFADIQMIYQKSIFRDEFLRAFLATTVFRAAESMFGSDIADTHLYNFKTLTNMSRLRSPKFVFAHFVLPHSPYVFDRNGKTARVSGHAIWHNDTNQYNDPVAYREQWMFAMKTTVGTIQQILKNSKKPPIILLQADHGINLITNNPDKVLVRHAILNAYHFPDRDYSALYPKISPVNSFRLLFNKYFGDDLEKLDDRVVYTYG